MIVTTEGKGILWTRGVKNAAFSSNPFFERCQGGGFVPKNLEKYLRAKGSSVKSLRILNAFVFLALILQIHFLYKLEEVATIDK